MLHHVPLDSICVVGSSVLTAYGIRKNHDVDFVMTSNYRKSFNSLGVVPFSENVEMVSANWARSKQRKPIADDELIRNPQYHFVYEGIKFAILPLLLERKEWQSREKDLVDVESIKLFMQSQEYKERICKQ